MTVKAVNKNSNTAPRLLTIAGAARYMSLSPWTIRSWLRFGLLEPVRLPGCAILGPGGKVIARPQQRTMRRILIERRQLDRLIEQGREQ